MNYICVIITKLVSTAELLYAVVLIIVITVPIILLIISYFVVQIIYSTFLKRLKVPPEKREVK